MKAASTLLIAVAMCAACASRPAPAAPPVAAPAVVVVEPAPVVAVAAGSPASPVPRPTKKLTVAEARRYMAALLNRDRATQKLAPLTLDEGPPTTAGQAHAEDMAKLGYLGHWGSDGSVPEQRHTEAGGADMVLENALCFTDEHLRTLDKAPLIDPAQIERAESMFFDEVPPNDGHRKNILRPAHTRIGIGIAQPIATPTELPVACIAQEITDDYGTYQPLPKRAKVGVTIHVEGTLAPGVVPTGVGLARVLAPLPIAASELNKRRSYPVPKPFQMYWGKGFVTPKPIAIDGTHFAIDVPLTDRGQEGLYEVSVWAKLPGSDEHAMVSLRTILVE